MASTTLEEKINKIRQKNEEIRRRHEEVEADKQNAAKLNALVKMVPPTDWPERKEPPEFSNPPPPRSNGNSKPKTSAREYRGQQQQYHAGGGDGKKIHVFAEGDGPPPDPTYNFLADSEREERTREDLRENNDRFRGRGGPLRGSSRRRGGGREGYSKEYRGSTGPKDASKPEYEAWRAERNRIDEARISRQRTAEGNWRREWDNNKINVEEDEAGATKSARLDIGDAVRKDHKEFDKWQVDGNDHDSPRGRGGKQYVSRGGPRGSHNNRAYQHSNSFDQFHGPVSPSPTKPPLSPNVIDERMVVATDKSIKVIVNHGTTPPKGPVMSVKVSSSSIAGTGRVGPRQKPRVLYSSQSETEVPGHEHEKFSGHKLADDKANRVSFNRDINEQQQQRYVPKSPHPQRKPESNLKSPYSTRKEFKYDSQQQRHGETEPKSPYLQRKEIKDSPKSPHFQRKPDFTNRDSHGKQKNNNQATDSFKTTHSQRRMSDKTKNDSPKFSGPKKFEDSTAPKPQRINKRIDKSKNFQHSSSKETHESNTNESQAQPNDLGTTTVEEADKSIANGNESHDVDNKSNITCEKDSPEHTVAVETVEENQDGDDNVSKLNIDTETFSPAIESEKVQESVSEVTKSIDNSEPMTRTCENATECPEALNAADTETEQELIVQNVETNAVAEIVTSNINCEKHSPEDTVAAETVKENQNGDDNVSKLNIDTETFSPAIELEKVQESVPEDTKSIDNSELMTPTCENVTECPEALSAADTETEKELIVQNVESNADAETVTPIPSETKADDSNKNVTDVEESKELPEITSTVQEVVEIQTIIDDNTHEDMPEIKDVQNILSDEKPKDEVNSALSADPEKFEELSEKAVTAKNELQSETQDEVPLEPEKITNEIEEAQNILESTSVVEKVDLSQSVQEPVPNNVDKQIIRDPEDKENPVI